jgi:hypothetical protein
LSVVSGRFGSLFALAGGTKLKMLPNRLDAAVAEQSLPASANLACRGIAGKLVRGPRLPGPRRSLVPILPAI